MSIRLDAERSAVLDELIRLHGFRAAGSVALLVGCSERSVQKHEQRLRSAPPAAACRRVRSVALHLMHPGWNRERIAAEIGSSRTVVSKWLTRWHRPPDPPEASEPPPPFDPLLPALLAAKILPLRSLRDIGLKGARVRFPWGGPSTEHPEAGEA